MAPTFHSGQLVGAAQEAVLRANVIAQTAPRGPVYVSFDLALQEDEIAALPPPPPAERFAPPQAAEPAGALVEQATDGPRKGLNPPPALR